MLRRIVWSTEQHIAISRRCTLSQWLAWCAARSLSHQFISISAIYVFMVAMTTARGSISRKPFILAAAAAAKKLPLALPCVCVCVCVCACSFYLRPLVVQSLHLACCSPRERVSFFANNQKGGAAENEFRRAGWWEVLLLLCCYCEKINFPALERASDEQQPSGGCSFSRLFTTRCDASEFICVWAGFEIRERPERSCIALLLEWLQILARCRYVIPQP
jgi:hypothetical protein